MKQFKMKSFAGVLSVLLGVCALAVRAEVLHVGPGQAYTDIASAITAANDHDVIEIDEGAYVLSAQLVVAKPITLKGAGPDKTFIDGNWNGTKQSGTGVMCLKVNHAKALVCDLCLRNGYSSNTGETGDGVGVRIDIDGGTVSNCVITGCCRGTRRRGGAGAYLKSTDALLTHCQITNNEEYYQGAAYDDTPYGTGVMVAKGTVSDCTISGNRPTSMRHVAAASTLRQPMPWYGIQSSAEIRCQAAMRPSGSMAVASV